MRKMGFPFGTSEAIIFFAHNGCVVSEGFAVSCRAQVKLFKLSHTDRSEDNET